MTHTPETVSRPWSGTARGIASDVLLPAAAAFCVYFCTYAFRKPFTAATFDQQDVFGVGLKAALVIAQLLGYMLSKFIGIKVISEMPRHHRAWTIVGLILIAELALVAFAFVPLRLKPLMMFANGLPLGMVFGLVLAYLEGKRHTEFLSSVLCASFIMSSGWVKSVGQWLLRDWGVSEVAMPMITGLVFLPPLLLSVWVLQKTPLPDETDRRLRRERTVMDRRDRQAFVGAYWPGLSLLVFVYIALTVLRTIRDDFAVELWRDMGTGQAPSVFGLTETVVGVCVMVLNALAICIRNNHTAIRAVIGLMCAAFGLVVLSVLLQRSGGTGPFTFMVLCGVGLYVPYVAFHTTVFERLIAVARSPCNLGFLLYLADAIGYLGYAVVIVAKTMGGMPTEVLPFFLWTGLVSAGLSIVALLAAALFIEKSVRSDSPAEAGEVPLAAAQELAPAK